ncbi:MAG: carbonic anhydrase [Candidatus Dormiibacterota bacterium]
MPVIDQLVAQNADYASSFRDGGLAASPRLGVAVVTCMDARIDVHRVLGLRAGDAHVIRNAGGAVTDDAIRSLVISQRLLGTREIVVMHHTECGMMTFRDDDLKRQIQEETGVRPAFALEAFTDLAADVLQSIRRIVNSPFIPHTDGVRGFIYDVRTGRLDEIAV